jgi:hypothetical protein
MNMYDPRGGSGSHHDQILSNISVGWFNQVEDAAAALFPKLPVQHQTDKYYVFDRSVWKQPSGGDYRAPGTEANETPGRQISDDNYYCQEHALQHPVTPEERANATAPIRPYQEATEDLTGKINRGRQLAAASIATNANNYPADHVEALASGEKWDDSSSDPVTQMRDMFRTFHLAMGVLPNTAVIPWRIMSYLEDHAEFRNRVQHVQAEIPSRFLASQFLEVNNVVVPGGRYDSARYGQEPDIGYLWGNNVVFAYVPERPALRTPSFGYEFVWPLYGVDNYVDRWWNNERKTNLVRVGRSYDLKLVAKEPTYDANGELQTGTQSIAGFLFQDVIADDTGL